jgi:hypothetical protein
MSPWRRTGGRRRRPGGGPAAPWQRAQEIRPAGGMATKEEIPPWRRTGGTAPWQGSAPGGGMEEREDGLAAMAAQQRRDDAKKNGSGLDLDENPNPNLL